MEEDTSNSVAHMVTDPYQPPENVVQPSEDVDAEEPGVLEEKKFEHAHRMESPDMEKDRESPGSGGNTWDSEGEAQGTEEESPEEQGKAREGDGEAPDRWDSLGDSMEMYMDQDEAEDVKPRLLTNGAVAPAPEGDTDSSEALDIKPRLAENGDVIPEGRVEHSSNNPEGTETIGKVNLQPYIPLVDIGEFGGAQPDPTAPAPAPFPTPQGASPVQTDILKGGFSVVPCQNGTLLIPNNPVRRSVMDQTTAQSDLAAFQSLAQNIPPIATDPTVMTQDYKVHKPHQCPQCDKTFSNKPYLRKHIKRVHKKGFLQVKLQAKKSVPVAKKKTAKKLPPKTAPPVENATFDEGNDKTKTFNGVEYHQKLICTVCDKILVKKADLVKHMLTEHTREVYQCSMCRRSFNTEYKMKKHIESHSKQSDSPSAQNSAQPVKQEITTNSDVTESGAESAPVIETDIALDGTTITGAGQPLGISVSIKQEPVDADVSMDSLEVDMSEQKPSVEEGAEENRARSTFEDFYYESEESKESPESADEDYKEEEDNESEEEQGEKVDLECIECDKKFTTVKAWQKHKQQGHNKFPCTECDKVFYNRGAKLKHMQELHPEKLEYGCTKCSTKFLTERGRMLHELRIHGEKPPPLQQAVRINVKCEECDETFPSFRFLNRHMSKAHPDVKRNARLQCDVCLKWINRTGFAMHQKACKEANFDGTNYFCDQCHKPFSDLSKMKIHKYQTHNKRFKCTQCDKGFGQRQQLEAHMVEHGAEKKFMCDVCSKLFISRQRLKIHQWVHQPREKSHKCDQCDSAFYKAKDLSAHVKSKHLGEGPKHLCNICGTSITTATNLRNHMRTHTGEKPHVCKVCGKGFAQWANLKRHFVTHTKEKKYKCDICGKGFPLSDALKRHMVTHTGEKPYQCDVCEMSFNQKSNLRTHKLLHNPDKPHKCAKCDKAYNHKVCLVQHMKSRHGIEMKDGE